MSVIGIASAAIALAREAARSAATAHDDELEGQLADLVVHLSVLRSHCAALHTENLTLRAAPPSAGADPNEADPVRVVGG
jgi:hypothetical protein